MAPAEHPRPVPSEDSYSRVSSEFESGHESDHVPTLHYCSMMTSGYPSAPDRGLPPGAPGKRTPPAPAMHQCSLSEVAQRKELRGQLGSRRCHVETNVRPTTTTEAALVGASPRSPAASATPCSLCGQASMSPAHSCFGGRSGVSRVPAGAEGMGRSQPQHAGALARTAALVVLTARVSASAAHTGATPLLHHSLATRATTWLHHSPPCMQPTADTRPATAHAQRSPPRQVLPRPALPALPASVPPALLPSQRILPLIPAPIPDCPSCPHNASSPTASPSATVPTAPVLDDSFRGVTASPAPAATAAAFAPTVTAPGLDRNDGP